LGDRGWERLIDRYFELAELAERTVRDRPSLTLLTERQSVNLCFQYRLLSAERTEEEQTAQQNALTLKIRQKLMEQGIAMVNYATIAGDVCFRLVICNNQTQPVDIESFLDAVVTIGESLTRQPQAVGRVG